MAVQIALIVERESTLMSLAAMLCLIALIALQASTLMSTVASQGPIVSTAFSARLFSCQGVMRLLTALIASANTKTSSAGPAAVATLAATEPVE